MPSRLILLPTETTINTAGLSKKKINRKRVLVSDDEDSNSDFDAHFKRVNGVEDVDSEASPDSDFDLNGTTTTTSQKQQHRKGSNSSSSSSGVGTTSSYYREGTHSTVTTTSSKMSFSGRSNLVTITVTTSAHKPSAWEIYKRKQQLKMTRT